MFDTPEKKLIFAVTKSRGLFPTISQEQTEHLAEIFADQFDPDYSPIREEQTSRIAIGSGADAEEFLAATGMWRLNIDEHNISIDRTRLYQAAHKMLVF